MPIYIFYNNASNETLASLCDGEWELCAQMYTLEKWLIDNHSELCKSEYIADIGFCSREFDEGSGIGGGGVLTTQMIKILDRIGMEIYFSEYPAHDIVLK